MEARDRELIEEKAAVAHDERLALGYGLGAVLLWSTVATGFKLGLEQLAVEQLLWLGSLISWSVFLVYALTTRALRLAVGDRWLVLTLGLINPLAYYLILFGAYDRLPAHIAQPLNYTWAITLAILAVPILGQKLSGRALAGILVSYTGVLLLLLTAEHGDGGWNTLGVVLALASTILWAAYWLLNTRCQSPPAAIMLWSFSVGTPLIGVVCLLGPGMPAFTPTNLFYGAWVGLIEMGVTFVLWQQALRRTANAARIGQLIFLSPFLSLVMIYLVLGEQIGWGAVAGLGVIVLGLNLARPPAAAG